MIQKRFSLIMAFLLFLGMLTACGQAGGGGGAGGVSTSLAAEEKTELIFYYPTQVGGGLATGMEDIVARFNGQSEDIHVTPVYTGSYKETAQKAMTDIAAGQGPNVVLSGMLDIVDYYGVGAVKEIGGLIDAEGSEWKNDFVEGFWGNFVMEDGGTYGLPFQHSVCVLFYNKDILNAAGVAEAPPNRADMETAIAAVAAYDPAIVPVEFPADVWVLETLTLSSGGSLAAGPQEPRFDSPEAVSSLDFMEKMIQGGGMIQSYAGAGEDFVAGSCAMTLNTTGNLGFVAADASFNWGVATLPAATSPGLSYGGGGLIMTEGQSPEQEAASWEFMKYLTSPEISAEWMTISGYFAVRKSSGELQIAKDFYAANPQLAEAAALLPYTTRQWSTNSYWDVYAHMQTALDRVLIAGDTPAKDALATAQEEAAGVLAG